MRRFAAVLLITGFAAAAAVKGSQPPDPDTQVSDVIKRVKSMAYRANDVDWPALEAKVRAAAKDAKDHVDLLAAYQVLVDGLGDGHSFLGVPRKDAEEFSRRYGRAYNSDRTFPDYSKTFVGRSQPAGRTLALGAAHARLVELPRFNGGGERAERFAQALYDATATGADSACAYVVDLRGNTGGNVWPMLAGIGVLFGDGPVSSGIDRDGKQASVAGVAGAASVFTAGAGASTTQARVPQWRALPRLPALPVAVLIDDAVASSGEGIAVAFRGRPNTRLFGQKTMGMASANEGFEAGDTNIIVTTQMMADRNAQTYPHGIAPDEAVAHGEGSAADPDDAVVEAAKAWLGRQPGCSGK